MSGTRFVGMLAPDVAEMAGRYFSNASGRPSEDGAMPSAIPQPPKFRSRKRGTPPSLGKQETAVPLTQTPDQIQATLHAVLAGFVDAQAGSLAKAEVMIKLTHYQREFANAAPSLDGNPELAEEVLGKWFQEGDPELKKALVNTLAGAEEFPLLTFTPSEGAENDLAKMVGAVPAGQPRAALLTKIQVYDQQLQQVHARAAAMNIGPQAVDETIAEWIEGGDGSHRALKKAVADVDRETRHRADTSVGENDAVDEKAGNAASHAGAKLSGQNDRTYVPRSTGEGAGPRMRGTEPAPGQANDPHANASSGPTDQGGGELRPKTIIRRKGTTGGLGSVSGESGDGGQHVAEDGDLTTDKGDARRKRKAMGKSGDLRIELVKIAPAAMIEALATLEPEDRVAVMGIAAQDMADLMAWSGQQEGRLQKSAMDAAVIDWLGTDPDLVVLKQWTAEALGSAGEIPLDLARSIMAYEPPQRPRLRQPYAVVA